MELFVNLFQRLLPFMSVTIIIAFSSMILGLIFGGILAAMKLSHILIVKKAANFYTTIIRCTPVIILLFLSYYGLPALIKAITGIDISSGSRITFAIIALTLFSSAILSEILRPAYLAVNKGQFEAAMMVGLSPIQAIRKIIIPQAFYIALPNMGNMLLSLIQQSALSFLIGVVDVMGQAKVINSLDYGTHIVMVYATVSFLYWILSLIVGKGIDGITLHMGKILQ